MSVTLRQAKREDMETIWKMQVEAFKSLLEVYQDYDMSPAAEGLDKVMARFEQPWNAPPAEEYPLVLNDMDFAIGNLACLRLVQP